MNDAASSPATTTTTEMVPEALVELDSGKDRGEASLPEPKTEPEKSVERQGRVEAGFTIVKNIRESVVAQGLISKDEANAFQIVSTRPKAETLLSRYTTVCQEIKDQADSPKEVIQLKTEQANLYLEYAYNTVALLEKHCRRAMSTLHDDAETQISQNRSPDQELNTRLSRMMDTATLLEQFRSSTEKLVPELVNQYPTLQQECVDLNADLLKFKTKRNELKDASDQSPHELSRFVYDLTQTISVETIQEFQTVMREYADGWDKSAPVVPEVDVQTEPESDPEKAEPTQAEQQIAKLDAIQDDAVSDQQ